MIFTTLLATVMLMCCGEPDQPSKGTDGSPVASVTVETPGSTSAILSVRLIRAERVWLLALTADDSKPAASEVRESGTSLPAGKGTLEGLKPSTDYVLYYCPESSEGKLGNVSSVEFRTISIEPYAWEKSRDGIPFFAQTALIYGGGPRTPKYWTPERIRTHVSWTDPDTGEEKWLFDAFLMLEMRTPANNPPHAFVVGIKDWSDPSIAMLSANQKDASEWLDYWFLENNGFWALDAAVAEVTSRIGPPPVTPKVIVMMPDIPAHERYNVPGSSTKYWGSVDGRELDFTSAADRVAAYRWYVDEVRTRFADANFQNIELGGFYIMTEELPSTRSGIGGNGGDHVDGVMLDGWEVAAKAWDDVFPAVSDYIHLFNEAVVWIPYRRAAGFRYWKDFGIDYAYMQPNRFWDSKGVNPMASFFSDIAAYKLLMELEIDDRVMVNPVDASDSSYNEGETYETYRARWREYVDGMMNAKVYGNKQLACYMGSDSFNHLLQSTVPEEQALINELCRLIADDPLKARNK